MRKKKKFFFIVFIFFILSFFSALFICNRVISNYATDKLYSDVNTIPFNRVGLLLGTNKYLTKGGLNAYYYYRIYAAVTLIRNKKIKYIIVSGDNS